MRVNGAAVDLSAEKANWIVFEQAGKIAFGEVAARFAKNIRLTSGERVSLHHLWMDDVPPPNPTLLDKINQQAATLSAAEIWRVAGGRALSLSELTAAIFVDKRDVADAVQALAVLDVLLAEPFYFYRNKGVLTPQPAELLEKIETSFRRREVQRLHEEAMEQELAVGAIPVEISEAAEALLYAPDKNTSAYRVLKKHLQGDKLAFVRFFIAQGALPDAHAYFAELFRRTCPEWQTDAAMECPAPSPLVGEVEAFSIDDAGTVEIDDAFSVVELPDGDWRIGIHIAAPGLCNDKVIDDVARQRLISVYFPDEKYTMLPAACVEAYSLAVGVARPAVSLYVHYTPATGQWRITETLLESVRLYATTTPEQINAGAVSPAVAAAYTKLMQVVDGITETTSGLVVNNAADNRADFKISANPAAVVERQRDGAAHVVAVLMRLVNSTWATRVAAAGRGGLYRIDGATRMRPKKEVAPYMWLSSPLRRYVDLINQRVLLSLMEVIPPVEEQWRDLAITFDKQYAQSRFFQRLMDRYWTLRALTERVGTTPLMAKHIGGGRLRLFDYPLVGGCPAAVLLEKGAEALVLVKTADWVEQCVELELTA